MMEKVTITFNADDEDFGAVLNCAVRYCIGRQTYMPSLVIEFIRPYLLYLNDKTLRCFERDLNEATYFGNENIDKPMWLQFKTEVEYELKRRGVSK